jgi:Domain of unknown function (DUF1772)
MYVTLQVLTVMLAAVTMALSLAHALELPGKLRLNKDEYLAVQPIYYPGFTIGGFAEVAVIVAALVLLLMTPGGAPEFWLIACALVAFVVVQVIFWAMTQPVNKYWLRETKLGGSAKRFFDTGTGNAPRDWTDARDRWERSHVLRAGAATLGMLLLTVAVAI